MTTHGIRRKRVLHVVPLPSTIESLFSSTLTFHTSLPVIPIPFPPPLSSALEPVVHISTPAVLVSNIPKPSQPQVVNAIPSTLSIMAHLDTLQELVVSMDSCIDACLIRMETRMDDLIFFIQQLGSLVIPPRQIGDFVTLADTRLEVDGGIEVIGFGSETRAPKVAQETMPILQTLLGDVAAKIFTSTIDFPDSAR